jgi:hypothetical protein
MVVIPLFRKILHIVLMSILIGAMAGPVFAYDLGSGTPATGTASISNGDPVTLNGIATGHPRDGLQVWVIGKNYLKISTIQVNNDNTFEFELSSPDTMNLAPGQYFVVVQHPMMNGLFDIWYDSSSGRVINRQMGTGGESIYQMSGAGSLQGPASAQALVNAISSQDIDDTFTTYTFTIAPPNAFVHPVGDHAVGDRFTITGSTNLAVGDQLMVDITSSSFTPTQKTSDSGFSGASGMVTVVPGTGGYNSWSFDVDASTFRPDEYSVTVSGITVDVTGSTVFNIVEPLPSATTVPAMAMGGTVVITTTTTVPVADTTTPTQSSLPFGIAAAALVVAVLAKRK